ncbi:MAG: hypothetical protein RLY16_2111 [Bacteroidota bacterium]
MNKAARALILYLVSLLAFSLLVNLFDVKSIELPFSVNGKENVKIQTMMSVTIFAGLICLKQLVSQKSFRVFVIIYSCLWVIRITLLIIAAQIGLVSIMGRNFRFDLIIFNYYENVSRIATPLPFILYWFINYLLFDKKQEDTKSNDELETTD